MKCVCCGTGWKSGRSERKCQKSSPVGQRGQDEEAPTAHPFPRKPAVQGTSKRAEGRSGARRAGEMCYIWFLFFSLLLRHWAFGIIRA